MRWHEPNGWGWGGVWMASLMVVFWAALIVVVVVLLRDGRRGHTGRPTPEQILEERLAHGDITVDEYEQRRAALRGRGADPPR